MRQNLVYLQYLPTSLEKCFDPKHQPLLLSWDAAFPMVTPALCIYLVYCIWCYWCGLLHIEETTCRLGNLFDEGHLEHQDLMELLVARHFDFRFHFHVDLPGLGRLHCRSETTCTQEEHHPVFRWGSLVVWTLNSLILNKSFIPLPFSFTPFLPLPPSLGSFPLLLLFISQPSPQSESLTSLLSSFFPCGSCSMAKVRRAVQHNDL